MFTRVRGKAGRAIPVFILAGLLACCTHAPPLVPPDPATLAAVNALRPAPCNATIASALDTYRVPVSDLRDLSYSVVSSGFQGDIAYYIAWMHLKSQPGYFIVDVDPGCQFRQAYTRGGAHLPGVPDL